MHLVKADPLKKGDTIAIIAPSSGLSALFPHRLDNAIKFLNKCGYVVKVMPTAKLVDNWSSAPAKERARDINSAFEDESVRAIICTAGGNTANQTLEYLDFDMIASRPKILCGYSDVGILHYAFMTRARMTTFYGPCAITQFGEYPKPLEYTTAHFESAISAVFATLNFEPSKAWTDEVLDWSKKLDLERPRKLIKNRGYEWLREGSATGPILGGCLSTITHLKGTEFWPDHEGAIFFIDIPIGKTIFEGEALPEVDALLADMSLCGALESMSGIVVGRPYHYSESDVQKLKEIVLKATDSIGIPVLYGADIGHTDPQVTIPLGCKAKIDSASNSFSILESGVSSRSGGK